MMVSRRSTFDLILPDARANVQQRLQTVWIMPQPKHWEVLLQEILSSLKTTLLQCYHGKWSDHQEASWSNLTGTNCSRGRARGRPAADSRNTYTHTKGWKRNHGSILNWNHRINQCNAQLKGDAFISKIMLVGMNFSSFGPLLHSVLHINMV